MGRFSWLTISRGAQALAWRADWAREHGKWDAAPAPAAGPPREDCSGCWHLSQTQTRQGYCGPRSVWYVCAFPLLFIHWASEARNTRYRSSQAFSFCPLSLPHTLTQRRRLTSTPLSQLLLLLASGTEYFHTLTRVWLSFHAYRNKEVEWSKVPPKTT